MLSLLLRLLPLLLLAQTSALQLPALVLVLVQERVHPNHGRQVGCLPQRLQRLRGIHRRGNCRVGRGSGFSHELHETFGASQLNAAKPRLTTKPACRLGFAGFSVRA